MTTHEVPDALRVEGFRVRRSFGFGSLSKGATIGGAMAVAVDGIIATASPASLIVTLPVTAAVVGLAAARRHGMSALTYYWAKVAWRRAARSDGAAYRKMFLPLPYALDLPGVGASTTLIEAHDPTTGQKVGVVHDRVNRHDAAGARWQSDGTHQRGTGEHPHLGPGPGRHVHRRAGQGRLCHHPDHSRRRGSAQ
ncbi:hypothetical protein TPA0910_44540 [Streptomyces hygroscopicus subsp. sporocinereus]|uniref:Uncharacterized protein n=1 Tax=Streptomyces hygroscopicus TaxID=1912 RepID=A0ABQ3U453_STRHY|nr:hypothetical protein TPA0910_44540 [Streptomyces hygroscopicus]